MTDHTANTSAIRRFIWPIFGKEHIIFLPMTLMISLILFNYTLLRNMKDTLVIGATEGSAIIPALKLFAVLPAAFLFFLVITKLYNMYSKEKVFNLIIITFMVFFAGFALVIYPNHDAFEAQRLSSWMLEVLPETTFFVNLANMVRFWAFTLFYTAAELWGSIVASLLFWQFANSIVKVTDAKRFYSHFYLLANLATALAGYLAVAYSDMGITSGYDFTVNLTISNMVIATFVILFLYNYINKKVNTDPDFEKPDSSAPKKKKPKLSVGESIKFVFSSPYLGLIALLVLCYGISINLVEVVWKNEVNAYIASQVDIFLQTPEGVLSTVSRADHIKSGIQAFMGNISMLNGIATFIVILVGSYFVRLLGWRFGALATPVIIGITGSIFFYFIIFDGSATPVAKYLGTSVLFMTVLFGSIQNILSKSTKYALFDPTKEMAYIPLDDDSKSKGKAAVDVVGGRLGKAGGSGIQQLIFLFTTGGVAGIAPILSIIVIGIIGIWIVSVIALNKRFQALSHESEELAREQANN